MLINFRHKKIKTEQSLGRKLQLARKRKGYNLALVEKETKVSMKYLAALENGRYDLLPADVYVIGFLRRYAIFLQLDDTELVEKFRAEKTIAQNLNSVKNPAKDSHLLKPNLSEKWLKRPGFLITPKLIFSGMILLLTVGILSYIWFQVKSFAAAPPLEINQPREEMIVNVQTITIKGQTDSDASLRINNEMVNIDNEGNFNQSIKLFSGINEIEITAKNKANKINKKVLKILAEF